MVCLSCFTIVEKPNFPPEALTPKAPEQEQLVGCSLLYCWPSVGWCVGVVTEANTDGRRTLDVDGKKVWSCVLRLLRARALTHPCPSSDMLVCCAHICACSRVCPRMCLLACVPALACCERERSEL